MSVSIYPEIWIQQRNPFKGSLQLTDSTYVFCCCMLQTVSITRYFDKNMSSDNCLVPSISFLRGLYFLPYSSPILLGSLWTVRKMMPKMFPSCSSAVLIESVWKNLGEQNSHLLTYELTCQNRFNTTPVKRSGSFYIEIHRGKNSSSLLDPRHPVREPMFPIARCTKLESGM